MDSRTLLIVIAILITELCERLTYYSITGNMVLFFQSILQIPTQTSVTINLAFTGVTYFIPIFGGWVADSVSGRYNAIYGSFLVYFVGALLLAFTNFDYLYYFGANQQLTVNEKRIFYFIGLGFIAVGSGGIKSNVSPFGAQQLASEGQGAVQTFFNWFYWFINLGSAIAFSAVVYVQQEINFFIGYLIPACCIFLGLIIFIIPRNCYECEDPGGSAFSDLFAIMVEGLSRKRRCRYKFRSFVDYARIRNGGNFSDESVDGLISIGRMIPIFLSLIMFWTIYFQTQSTFLVQAERMNIKLGSVSLPVASLNLFNTIIILIATPVVDRIVLPILTRFNGGEAPSLLNRMGFGMLLAAASTFAAGGIEIARKNDIAEHGVIIQNLPGANVTFNASSMSVLYQMPQFMLIGLGEIFTSITGLEFAFSEAPVRLRSIIMGVNLCTSGIGSFLGSALVALVGVATQPNNWMPDEINNGHFEYFCFLLGGIMIVNAIIFIPISRWYKRKKEDDYTNQMEKEAIISYGSFEEKTSL